MKGWLKLHSRQKFQRNEENSDDIAHQIQLNKATTATFFKTEELLNLNQHREVFSL
jgi:hypothetical protein